MACISPGRLARYISRVATIRQVAARGRAGRLVALVATMAMTGAALSACSIGGSPTYAVDAVFPSAPGLFPGNAVQVLGVSAGKVASVRNVGDRVVVRLELPASTVLPRDVEASLVTPEILGEPSVELQPGYTGGPRLSGGATIPESRTSVPVSTNRFLRDTEQYLRQIDPHALGGLVGNLAQDLSGQGQNLNQLISHAAVTLQLLARKGNDLGRLDGTLAQLMATLDTRTAAITSLIDSYDQVSGVIAANQGPLGNSLTELVDASTQLSALLAPNLSPLEGEISTVTTVGRTLDRNLTGIDNLLSGSATLFGAVQRGFSTNQRYQWIRLNNALAPGVSTAVLAGEVRDRLAGICRRILANHSAGLAASALSTLATCGNPASGFFDPVTNLVLGLVDNLPGSVSGNGAPSVGAQTAPGISAGSQPTSTSSSPAAAFAKGLGSIPGLSSADRSALLSPSAAQATSGTPTLSPPASGALGKLPPLPSAGQASASSGSSGGFLGLGGLLHDIVGAIGSWL